MRTIGIDIGGTSVKAAGRNGADVLWTGQSDFYHKPTLPSLTAAVRQAISGRTAGVEAVGLCVPGLLDPKRTRVMLSVNLPGLMEIPLLELIERSLGIELARPPVVLNDAVATAHDIASARKLAGRVLVLALGTGVGAAVVDDGEPLYVEGGSPGHIGQLDVSVPGDAVIGPDGGGGGLEGYIGVPALLRRYGGVREAIALMDVASPPIRALVHAIRICHAIYRPDHVVLGGGIGVRIGHLTTAMRGAIETNLTNIARTGWTISVADDDFHAARGAAEMVLDPPPPAPPDTHYWDAIPRPKPAARAG